MFSHFSLSRLPRTAAALLLLLSHPAVAGIPITIQPLGDSITAGVDGTDDIGNGGYRRELQRLLGRSGITTNFLGTNGAVGDSSLPDRDHEGYPGYQINGRTPGESYLNLRLEIKEKQALTSPEPDIIILMIGTNDVSWKDTPIDALRAEELTADFLLLIQEVRTESPDSILLVSSIPPVVSVAGTTRAPASKIKAFNDIVRTAVATDVENGFETRFTDGFSAFTSLQSDINQFDGVHPSLSGYKKLGAHFYEEIEKIYFSDYSLYRNSVELAGGWRESPSYGYFWDNAKSHQSGWKYHEDIGWMFTASSKGSSDLWLWKPKWGWMFTSDELYPYVYRNATEHWYFFEDNTGFAVNLDTDKKLAIPAF